MPASQITSRVFGIDIRSLAAFRIGIGCLLLVDIALRASDLTAHYTDSGILPRDVIASRFEGTWHWSLHMLSGSTEFQAFLFALAAVFAALLTLGVWTRVATIVSWVLLVSIQERNPLVINGGDVLLRMLLLWAIFLPLDRRWSLARKHRKMDSSTPVVASVASAAILVQLALMYWTSGYFKYNGAWLSSDTLYRILQSDCYAKPLAYVLVEYPSLVSLTTMAVLWSELILPPLLFSPVWTKAIRLFAIVWFAGFHLGIDLALTVGLFSYVSWIAWLLFVPSSVWDWVAPMDPPDPESDPLEARSRRQRYVSIGGNVMAGFLLLYVCWNAVSTLQEPWAKELMPTWGRRVGNLLVLRQKWSLFSRPMKNDGWYVAVGRLQDGEAIDLLRDGLPADWDSYEKPKYIYRRSPNHRWRKMYRRLVSDRYKRYRDPLCRYLGEHWNATHPEAQITSIELHFMEEMGEDDRYQQRFFSTIELD